MEKETENFLSKLFSEHNKIIEFFFVGVILAIALNLIAGSISDVLNLNAVNIFFLGVILLLGALTYVLSQTFGRLINEVVLDGFLLYDENLYKIIGVPRYHYHNAVQRYLTAIFSENETIKAFWDHPQSNRSDLLIEATIYYILTEMSTHLSEYFKNQHNLTENLSEFGRDALSEIVRHNRFLDLFSMPLDRRPHLDKTNYIPLFLKLPSGSTIHCQSNSSFVVKTKRVIINIDLSHEKFSPDDFLSHLFKIVYLNQDDDCHLTGYRMHIKLRVSFSRIAIFSKTGWQYYQWIDNFIQDIHNKSSQNLFLEKIGWENTQTIVEGYERLSRHREQKTQQAIELLRSDRKEFLETRYLSKWLINFHDYVSKEFGVFNILPVVDFYGIKAQIPFLTKPSWNSPERLDDLQQIIPEKDTIVQYDQTFISEYDIDYDLINQRKLIGQRVWDAPTVYLDYISGSAKDKNIVFHAKTCRYYASLTKMLKLENETMRSVKNNDFINCEIRRKHYTILKNIESNLYKPLTLGCNVVFVIKTESDYEVIIQTRSGENVTDNNVTTTVPSFGLGPFVGERPEKQGLLFYNFLQEYLEELHNVKDLDQPFKTKGSFDGYYDSIYSHPETISLLNTNFGLFYLGFGFILSNGYPAIGLLAKLDDIEEGKRLKRKIKPNWEIAERATIDQGPNPLEFVSIHDGDRMKQLYPQLGPIAVYFLDIARKCLQ
jgi:hypothetical protein